MIALLLCSLEQIGFVILPAAIAHLMERNSVFMWTHATACVHAHILIAGCVCVWGSMRTTAYVVRRYKSRIERTSAATTGTE